MAVAADNGIDEARRDRARHVEISERGAHDDRSDAFDTSEHSPPAWASPITIVAPADRSRVASSIRVRSRGATARSVTFAAIVWVSASW